MFRFMILHNKKHKERFNDRKTLTNHIQIIYNYIFDRNTNNVGSKDFSDLHTNGDLKQK